MHTMEALRKSAGALEVLWTKELADSDAAAYDGFVREAASGHFMQTRPWADVARAGRPCQARYFMVREVGRVLGTALVLRTSAGVIPLPAASVDRGPVCASPADVPRVLAELSRVARRHGIAHLRVMPYWANDEVEGIQRMLADARFQDVQKLDGAHVATLRLDIGGKTGDTMFAEKARDQVRRRFHQAERAGATGRAGARADFEVHRRLSGEVMAAQGKGDKPAAWYDALFTSMLTDPARGALFVCEHEGSVVGTVAVLRNGPLATYAYGATANLPLKFNKTILALREAIRWARDQGCQVFDLGGIAMDGDDDPKRAAITEFKLHFSKTRIRLVREHARWF